MTIGCPRIGLVNDPNSSPQVRTSLRVITYLALGGERFYPYCLALYALRRICFDLFGINLELDWGTSDHADAFIKAHRLFHSRPSICDKPTTRQNITLLEVETENNSETTGKNLRAS